MRDLQAPRPRVSRETRLLFVTIACAIAALWVLGRLRFPERASTSPVPAVLAPLALPSSFDELAGVAEKNCPVSKLLNAEITLDATLL